ncbi:MAG TPA: CpsD/CapB family tyrosine-protein kinase [Isosphaeraceae bacterium]|jgi:capsular exopolysaccharide synthesis family protein|nr:CpsD/CapB family tyrosine-protein kinase [Isosphaeraceae bacterium]
MNTGVPALPPTPPDGRPQVVLGRQVAAPPAALAAGPGLGQLLRGLRRRWPLALGLGLPLAAAAAALTWSFLPVSRYTAQAMLQVASAPSNFVFKNPELEAADRSEYRNYQLTQQTLIKSPFVLNAALSDPKASRLAIVRKHADPVEWLEKKLSITFTGEVMFISLDGDDPAELAELVNAVTLAYEKEVVNAEHTKRLERYNALKEIYAKYQSGLRARREELKGLAEKAGSNDKQTLALKQQLAIEAHAAAERELRQVQSELRRAEIELKIVREAPAGSARPVAAAAGAAGPPTGLEAAVAATKAVREAAAQVETLRGQWAVARGRVREGGDVSAVRLGERYRKAQADLDAARAAAREELLARSADGAPAAAALAAGRPATAGDPREVLRARVKFLREDEKALKAVVGSLADGTQAFNQKTISIESITDEIQSAEDAFKQIGSRVEALNVELDAPLRVRRFQLAEPPRSPRLSKLAMATAAAGLGTLAAVVLGVSYLDARGRRIVAVEEVVHGLGMDLVGVLPALPDRRGRRALGDAREREAIWGSILLESVNSARALLLHAARADGLRVLMVASAVKGEGKTSLAGHLATSLARAGRRTLLLDADLRSPAAHRLFDLPLERGTCELLRGQATLAEALRPTVVPGLALVSAGYFDDRAVRALAQGDLQAVLDGARAEFDFIVIDTAPVLPVADTLHIAQHADGVIFSVLRDVSRLPAVHAAYQRLARLGVRMLGAVVAGAPCKDYQAAYAYNYATPPSAPAVAEPA